MKMTNKDTQVDDPDRDDERTCKLAVCNECFGISKKLFRTKTDERALAAGGAKWQAK
jgi:hypothetical protein